MLRSATIPFNVSSMPLSSTRYKSSGKVSATDNDLILTGRVANPMYRDSWPQNPARTRRPNRCGSPHARQRRGIEHLVHVELERQARRRNLPHANLILWVLIDVLSGKRSPSLG